MDRLRQR